MRRTALGITVVAAASISLFIFFSVDGSSHSVSDTFYGSVVPIGLVWLAALAVLAIAARTMKSP